MEKIDGIELTLDERKEYRKNFAEWLGVYEAEKKDGTASTQVFADRVFDGLNNILSARKDVTSHAPRRKPDDTGNIPGKSGFVKMSP